jgi:hypothetical protein
VERSEVTDYEVLRRFSADGVLEAKLLARSLFGASFAQDVQLAVAGNRAAVVSPATGEWVLASEQGNLERRGRLPEELREGIIASAALTSFGQLFISHNRRAGGPVLLDLTGDSKPSKLALPGSENGFYLLGAEGDELVIRAKPSDRIHWLLTK